VTLPSLFFSHGAPTLPLADKPARTFLIQLGEAIDQPKAILVISAHWETVWPTVNAVSRNETINLTNRGEMIASAAPIGRYVELAVCRGAA
jgi:aromatic ring-opening dioxygenase catalytic subunit (LigB family)